MKIIIRLSKDTAINMIEEELTENIMETHQLIILEIARILGKYGIEHEDIYVEWQ